MLSVTLRNELLDHALQGSTLYLALLVDDGAGGKVELATPSYARQEITFDVASNGEAKLSADVLFPLATEDWGAIKSFYIFDVPTGGDFKIAGDFSTAKAVGVDDQFKVGAGKLAIKLL
ncbi:hypothetical protein SP15_234 [Bacillus phage SP-15]|uniref:Uncharacterized protein n=1 Tax=Bacillus phage SP-15 TaxID=1792032 RepID=A0A127AWR8_9CAUD|nr:hypothetical protein SP15_234 [Bacillus phage SP-15]AMM45037.1 hypothetical protein SP15_234 [Bacillus phage SP-15]